MSKHHILVLGSTGPSGLAFCEAALSANHRLTLLVRSPQKVPQAITENVNTSILQGDIENEVALKAAAGCGANIFVSFIGPALGKNQPSITDGYKRFLPLLVQNRFERALILGTPSWAAPDDRRPLTTKFLVGIVWMFAGSAYKDFVGVGDYVTSLSLDELKWTLFRVPLLTNAAPSKVYAGPAGAPNVGSKLSRSSMARWLVQEIDEGSWIGKTPCISNCEYKYVKFAIITLTVSQKRRQGFGSELSVVQGVFFARTY